MIARIQTMIQTEIQYLMRMLKPKTLMTLNQMTIMKLKKVQIMMTQMMPMITNLMIKQMPNLQDHSLKRGAETSKDKMRKEETLLLMENHQVLKLLPLFLLVLEQMDLLVLTARN
jgi:hypothetical protein